jgi:hypothetical protein
MLGFCDLVGVGIAALSKKLAVKGLLDMGKYKRHKKGGLKLTCNVKVYVKQ